MRRILLLLAAVLMICSGCEKETEYSYYTSQELSIMRILCDTYENYSANYWCTIPPSRCIEFVTLNYTPFEIGNGLVDAMVDGICISRYSSSYKRTYYYFKIDFERNFIDLYCICTSSSLLLKDIVETRPIWNITTGGYEFKIGYDDTMQKWSLKLNDRMFYKL